MKKLTLLLFLTQFLLYAQTSKFEYYFDTVLEDTEIFIEDGLSFYTYPIRMDEYEWLGTAGISVATYLAIQYDDNLRIKFGTEVGKYNSKFWKATEAYGVVQYAEALGAGIYLFGLFGEDDEVRKLGRMVVQSLTYSGLTAMFLRMIAGRKRPPFTDDPNNFIGFTTNNSYQSFPSGHTTVAFALSTIMAEHFDSPWSRLGFYGLASLSAVERLINSQHWFTDVALGAALGILSGFHVLNEDAKREKKGKNRLSISPYLNGIRLQYRLN